jgi:uncharacterized protein (TIGR03086 family)
MLLLMISIEQQTGEALRRAVELDRRAVGVSVELVSGIGPADLGRATPCAGWTLADLLAHLTAQHRGFAAAAAGGGRAEGVWTPVAEADPVAAYRAAAEELVESFAVLHDSSTMWLPELSAERPFPALLAVRFHLVDYAVHSWDAARALGTEPALDAEVLDAALAIALQVPDDPERRGPGRAFLPSVPPSPDAGPLDRMLTALGRSPSWPDAPAA